MYYVTVSPDLVETSNIELKAELKAELSKICQESAMQCMAFRFNHIYAQVTIVIPEGKIESSFDRTTKQPIAGGKSFEQPLTPFIIAQYHTSLSAMEKIFHETKGDIK